MKRVSTVRAQIGRIDGALYEAEFEGRDPGEEAGAATLWPGTDDFEDQLVTPAVDSDDADDQGLIEPPSVEEMFEYGAEIDEPELVRVLGGPMGDQIRQSVLQQGVDALAYYVTFHAKGRQWGIYIPLSKLFYVAVEVFGPLPVSLAVKVRIAFRALHQHELYHFATDYMSAQWEAITGRPCHRPARALRDPTEKCILLEEELANAHMLRALRGGQTAFRIRGRAAALRQYVLHQPAGYRDAPRSTARAAFYSGCERLATAYIGTIAGFDRKYLDGVDLLSSYPLTPSIDWRYCPIHIIHDEARLRIPPFDLSLFRRIESVVEDHRFRQRLAELPRKIQDAWSKKKELLSSTTAAKGLDFKFWERRTDRTVYSIRLSESYRAHLAHWQGVWTAISIGTHKEMGHG